jgi:hypothetical protein
MIEWPIAQVVDREVRGDSMKKLVISVWINKVELN